MIKDLSECGVQPSHSPARGNFETNIEALFISFSFLTGFGILVCAHSEFIASEPTSKMIPLALAWALAFLQVIRFVIRLLSEIDPNRQLVRMGVPAVIWQFLTSFSTVYTATVFGAAWFHGSWLYRPFLAAALVCIVAMIRSFAGTFYAAAQGGGAGLDHDEH